MLCHWNQSVSHVASKSGWRNALFIDEALHDESDLLPFRLASSPKTVSKRGVHSTGIAPLQCCRPPQPTRRGELRRRCVSPHLKSVGGACVDKRKKVNSNVCESRLR
ncbi:hypothetical protein IF1G_06485 [Cordyceps javanica]|uniref:Uncharacterized protein n=1 Tax=Cordyceps javanica TaxID=43265 RepID=A0A545UYB3_9HYPO|nr:hypothetical protein IF1G_06485 [Cordyceps javanica]